MRLRLGCRGSPGEPCSAGVRSCRIPAPTKRCTSRWSVARGRSSRFAGSVSLYS